MPFVREKGEAIVGLARREGGERRGGWAISSEAGLGGIRRREGREEVALAGWAKEGERAQLGHGPERKEGRRRAMMWAEEREERRLSPVSIFYF